jgi:hypothetical protein
MANRDRLQKVVEALEANGFGPAYIDPCSGEVAFKATVYWDSAGFYNTTDAISPPSNLSMQDALKIIHAADSKIEA